MATIQLSGKTVSIPDTLLADYRTRVNNGEGANKVALDFFQKGANDIQSNNYSGSVLGKYGVNEGSSSLYVGARDNTDTQVLALAAHLAGKAAPADYAPGSLQEGSSNSITKEWPTIAAPADQSKNPINVNPTNDAGQIAYNQRLANMQAQNTTPAVGTTAYTNYLLGGNYFTEGQGGTGQIKPFIPSASLPSVNTGVPNTQVGNIGAATAGTAGLSVGLDATMKAQQEAIKNIEKQQAEGQSWLQNFLSSTPTATQTRAQLEQQTGMNSAEYFADQKARIAEIDTLTQQYNGIVAARDAQIAASYDKLSTTNFINNQIAQINRNAAPELSRMSANINAKAATAQALQGNFDKAQTYINQAVQDATYDTKFKVDAFSMFYNMNQDSLSRLDTQYQNAMNRAYDIAKLQHQEDLTLKNTLADLQLKNPQVSINLNGTLEQAISAVNAKPQPGKGDIFGSADTGYFERFYDPATNSYKTRSVGGGGGSGGSGTITVTDPRTGVKTTISSAAANFDEYIINAMADGQSAQSAAQLALAYANDLKVKVTLSDLVARANSLKKITPNGGFNTISEGPSFVNQTTPSKTSFSTPTSTKPLKSLSGLGDITSGASNFFSNLFGR